MAAPSPTIEVRASFADPAAAEAAADELSRSGVPRSSIDIEHGVLPGERTREARFVWRVLVAILLWSVVGAIPGAAFGWLLAQTIGPEGTAGLVMQVVCWTIVGHLVGGLLAGYLLLADRSEEEMPPDRPVSLLTVRGVPASDLRRVRTTLRSMRPLDLLSADA